MIVTGYDKKGNNMRKCPKCNSDNSETQQFCGKCGFKLGSVKDIAALPTKSLVTPRVEFTTGFIFAGRYQVVEMLGEGGMGKVYKVIDKQLNEEVALKLIRPEIATDKKTIKRFSNELKLSRKISHRNVGRMYELMEDKGALFITMEYVPGQDLKGLIGQSGRLATGTAISIAKQICDGLAEAHLQGVIHRDLKSNNIMIDKGGNVRIMDFGIARSLTGKSITRAGAMIGTPEYMSPEQAEAEELDQRSDIYSLGVILYEMVTGHVPFEGENPLSVAMKHKTQMPTDPKKLNPQIPVELSRLILKCLEKDRKDRYQNAEQVRSELENIEMGIPTAERVIPRKRTVTSKEITVTFNLRRFCILASVIVALVIAVAIIFKYLPNQDTVSSQPDIPSIAVLPFEDLSPAKDQEYFCDGITEELINALTQIKDLRVIARTSTFSYKGKNVNIRDIGSQLNVATILKGSVRTADNRLRITAQLIDTTGGHHLWSDRYDRQMGDVFAIQDEITLAIVDTLKPKLLSQEKARLTKRQPVDIKAYNLYLEGLFFSNKRGEINLKKAVECFQQAIEKDPNFAPAYAGLALSYGLRPIYASIPPKETIMKAREIAQKAIEIDETLPEVHSILGFIKTWYDWDWEGAEREYKRAIELNPGYAGAHRGYSYNLMFRARFDEAIKEMEQALELDPLSVVVNHELGIIYINTGQFDHAVNALKRSLAMDPSRVYAHHHLGEAYLGKSMYDKALVEFQKEREISKGAQVWTEVYIGRTYVEMGKADEAQKVLDNLLERSKTEYVPPFILACFHFVLGEDDTGFEWLNRAHKEQDTWLCWLKINLELDSVRSDPRYTDLLRKMNLDD